MTIVFNDKLILVNIAINIWFEFKPGGPVKYAFCSLLKRYPFFNIRTLQTL